MKDAGVRKYDVKHVIMVGASTRMPRLRQAAQEIFDRKPLTSINCEEVVAYGAGVLGGVLKGEVKDVLALETTPLSIGVETLGGAMATLIPRNTLLPHQVNQMITTAWDNQKEATIKVYQGEREMVADNKLLGEFKIKNIPPGPRGSVNIELIMVLDEDGLMNVTAINRNTGTEENLIVQRINDVSDDYIESIKQSAEKAAKADYHHRQLVEAKAEIDTLIDSAKLSLDVNAKFLTENLRNQVIQGIENITTARESDDPKFLGKKIDEFGLISEKVRLAICGEDPERKSKQKRESSFAAESEGDEEEDDDVSHPIKRRKSTSISDDENDSDYSLDNDYETDSEDGNKNDHEDDTSQRRRRLTNRIVESESELDDDKYEVESDEDYRIGRKNKRASYDEDDSISQGDEDSDSDDKNAVEDDDIESDLARGRRNIRDCDHEHEDDEEPTNLRRRKLIRRNGKSVLDEDSDDDVTDAYRPLGVKRGTSGRDIDYDEDDEILDTNRRTNKSSRRNRGSDSISDYEDTDDELWPSQKKRRKSVTDIDNYDDRKQSTRRRKEPRDSYSDDSDHEDEFRLSPDRNIMGDDNTSESFPAYKGRKETMKEASKHSVLASVLYDDYEDYSEESYDSESFSGYEHDSDDDEEEGEEEEEEDAK
jgi:hypothetical protein